MNNRARDHRRSPTHTTESTVRRVAVESSSAVVSRSGGVRFEAYDALDYRLMATFPASDATATY